MKTIHFDSIPLVGQVEEALSVIRGVSLIQQGEAEGHGMHVDRDCLEQMLGQAKAAGKLPCRLNHTGGVEDIIGFFESFQIRGDKLVADLHLIRSHPQTAQTLEKAQRMAGCFGLSVVFVGAGEDVGGQTVARCSRLKGADLVVSPASNRDGLFSARETMEAGNTKLLAAVVMLKRKGRYLKFMRVPGPVSRSRNTGGQFAPEAASVPVDGNTMAAAYGPIDQMRVSRQKAIWNAWKNRTLVMPVGNAPVVASAIERAVIMLAQRDRQRRGLPASVTAGISGAASGAILGGIRILRRGTSIADALRSVGIGAAAGAAIAGGGSFVGSKLIGDPKESESAPFTKRTTIGGAVVGAGLGAAGVLASRRIPWAQRKAADLAKEWRPIAAITQAKSGVAVAGGAAAGGAIGAAQGADEGQQVDSIRNLRRDRNKRQSAQTALSAARQNLIHL